MRSKRANVALTTVGAREYFGTGLADISSMRTRNDFVEDEAEARVRMLREALGRTVAPSEYRKSLLLDVIETYCPVPEGEEE